MKKFIIIFLFFVVFCDNNQDKTVEMHSIIDAKGREVIIPKKVSRLITIDRGFSPQVLKVFDKDKLLVATGGVHPKSGPYTREKSDTFFLVPSIIELPTVGWAGYGNYDFEKILEVSPEVIIIVAYNGLANNSYQEELLNRLENEFHIPVVVLEDYGSIQGQESIEAYYNNIKILGEITDSVDSSEKLIKKLKEQIKKAQSFIIENKADKMLFLGITDSETGGGYIHGQDYAGASLTTSLLKIKNVLTNADMPILGSENILEYNPDIIALLDSPVFHQAQQVYSKNSIFNNIKAVQNNRVYFTGQLQWWGDSKLMLPLQLILFSAIYYKPENINFRILYEEYMRDIFELTQVESKQLATIHSLDSLLER